jgi:serine/threonine-protein kinase/endoribonuclease IRE1
MSTSVAVFDVLKGSNGQQPFVLLQPGARLHDLMPHVDLPAAAKSDRFPNLYSAYVGLCDGSGSLYAMTPEQFPLVVFGDTNIADGGARELIDPPSGQVLDSHSPHETAASTRARNLRQMCLQGLKDRRCLTGPRKLEESSQSRWDKLLDTASPISLPPLSNSNSEAIDSEGYSGDPLPKWGNGFVTSRWFWDANGKAPIRLLGLDTPFDSVSALTSLFLAFVLSAIWLTTKKLRGRRLTAVSVDSQVSEPVTPSLNTSSTIEGHAVEPPRPSESTLRPDNVLVPNGTSQARSGPAEDGEESDRDTDTNVTPGKRKGPRRRRGKKKKANLLGLNEEVEDEEKLPNNGKGELEKVPVTPLPAPPVITPPPSTPIPGSSLVVSDTILGTSCTTVAFQLSY